MNNRFWVQLRHEILLAFRSPQDLANPILFFLMVSSLLPLAVGADTALLSRLGGGMIWVMALLACLLSLDQLFYSDYEDGSLDQLLVSDQVFWAVLAKVLSHWLLSGLPLALLSPLLAIMFSLPEITYWLLPCSLLIGTLAFSLIGAIGAALTVCLSKGGLLLTLIVIPLYIPPLIFGAGTVVRAIDGYNAAGTLAVLAALCVFALALAPLAISAALRIGAEG